MATSTNYGWAEPDNSSLVKNGAQDIRTLGNAIDTSVWNVGYGQAGKNKLINGDFNIWQRGTTAAINSYGADRWVSGGGYGTQSRQDLAIGAITGYEAPYFCQVVTAANSAAGDYGIFEQRIEDVRSLAGQAITISFYAKAASGTPKIGLELAQVFGSGGSGSVFTAVQAVTLSTTWTRYTVTTTVPSISGKTIGAGSFLGISNWVTAGSTYAVRSSNIGNQAATFQFAGYQVEYGSKATPFQTASGGSPQAELAMCQRYFERQDSALGTTFTPFGAGACSSTTQAYNTISYTYKRTSPSLSFAAANTFQQTNSAGSGVTCTAISSAASGVTSALILGTVASGLVAGNATTLYRNSSSAAYIDISAEL
jgi:hypothetical protein